MSNASTVRRHSVERIPLPKCHYHQVPHVGPWHSLANCDSCPTPAKSEAIDYLQVGPTEIRYSIAWTIFVYL